MDKSINDLSGIEFEKLCQSLLQKLGFEVETTKQSGDGGIDLIAYNRQPFYSGKYIIQCKRYIGSVGEPVVRDLYGVVMAERANKGILITSGHFTASAYRFAKNKNLELMDGETLTTILANYNMTEQTVASKKNHFTQYQCFDKPKYEFYKNMVSQNMCTIEMGQDFLFDFLFDYLIASNKTDEMNNMIHNGFAEEFLKLFEWYTGKYYKKGKDNLRKLETYVCQYKGIAQVYNFELFEYVQSRYKILTQNVSWGKFSVDYRADDDYRRNGEKHYSRFYLMDWNEAYYKTEKNYIIKNLNNVDRVMFAEDEDFFEIMNLLSLFNYFEIQSGVDYINNLLFGCFPELGKWVQSQQVYKNSINSFKISYKDDTNKMGKKNYCVDMTSYFDKFKITEEERISVEIEKIKTMILSLKEIIVDLR